MDFASAIEDCLLQADKEFDELCSQLTEQQLAELCDSTHNNLQQPHLAFSTQLHPTSRFAKPKTEQDVLLAQANAVPQNTSKTTNWCINLWEQWRKNRKDLCGNYPPPIYLCTIESLNSWLCKFILEIRRKDGKEYPPRTIYAISCGLLRHVRERCPGINFFKDSEFDSFRKTLDGEMRRLRAQGLGVQRKQAEPFSIEEENKLWSDGLLGADSPQILLDTMVFMCGLYFALRSGQEHRDLQYSQIRLVEPPTASTPHLIYTENISKNNSGGIAKRKQEPKVVTHHANLDNPSRCFVQLYKQYIQHCPDPLKRKCNAFYLTPLKKPKDNIWFSVTPIGHNTLSKTVGRLCSAAGITGFKTNHSLRVTTATRLFQSGIDEQLIMSRTGHCSLEGIRTYKRVSENQQEEVSAVLNGATNEPELKSPKQKKSKTAILTQQHPYTLNLSNCTDITINYS